MNTRQRLIICYDGTWNDPQDRTNVYRFCRDLEDYDGEIRQRFFYDPGVGTSTWTRLRGGMTGYGLSENLLQGYDWLVRRYATGDEIWIIGFSRGAYTARSLAGLLRKCGLLHLSTPGLLAATHKLYRNKDLHPDDPACGDFRERYSREAGIDFLGVWDTVGALGIPGTNLSEKGVYAWHDTQLSKIVKRAYQAMALDENRAAYNVCLWTTPSGQAKPGQEVEQRWFIGAHANVGGGYGDDPLAGLPLCWLQEKAATAGLLLRPHAPAADAWKAPPRDSFKEFMSGAYSTVRKLLHKGDGRFFRAFDRDYKGNPAVNVSVDPSVWTRWRADPAYRPQTLVNAGQQPPE